ncbi:MAG: outer membrane protein assembly factor BamD [Vicinamibacterales bacterium]
MDVFPAGRLIGRSSATRLLTVVTVAVLLAACGAARNAGPARPGQDPDQVLDEQGTQNLQEQRWLSAREYFRQIVDGYPQSPVRPDAKLGIGQTYLGEGTAESLILAENEFREFLSFYPTHAKADFAQYQLAMSHYQQMRAPERDQTETRAALREFDAFFERFPDSMLTAEVREKWREARDRLSESSYRVGFYYYRASWYPGAIDRFKEILQEDPGFSGRDAVYYHLAESLARTDKQAEAVPYLQRLLDEFPMSEHLEDARKRFQELTAQ